MCFRHPNLASMSGVVSLRKRRFREPTIASMLGFIQPPNSAVRRSGGARPRGKGRQPPPPTAKGCASEERSDLNNNTTNQYATWLCGGRVLSPPTAARTCVYISQPASPNLNCIGCNGLWLACAVTWVCGCSHVPRARPARIVHPGYLHLCDATVSLTPPCLVSSAWIGLDPAANSARSACGLLTTTPAVNSLPDGHGSPLGLIASFYRRLRLSVGVVPSWAPPTTPLRLCPFLWTARVHPHGHGLVAGLSTWELRSHPTMAR